jgi:hypothetical protein
MDLKNAIAAAFFYKISALNGDGIDSVRQKLARAMSLRNQILEIDEDDKPPIVVSPHSVNPGPKCC